MSYVFGKGRSRWAPILLLLPGMFLYFLIALGPSMATIAFSFTDATGVGGEVHWMNPFYANYEEFLLLGKASRDNIAALNRTFIFCFLVSTIQFGIGLLIAILLNRKLPGTNFFRTLFFLPVILGVAVQGLMWKLFLNPADGPLAALGIPPEYLLTQPTPSFYWVIVVQIWANVGITMVIFLSGLQTIPDELVEAALIDGASKWQVFRHVTWPLLTPSVNTNLILNIIGSLQAWQLFYVIIGWVPGAQVLGHVVFAKGFGQEGGSVSQGFRQGYAAAASVVLFVIVLIIGLSTQYLLQRREERLIG